MTSKYFSKFPAIFYSNTESKDISRRIKIEPKEKNNPFNFYPFMLQDDLRADQVAEFYYNDPELDWLVYHVNDVIDPYYDWYQTNEVFETVLKEKYGSMENSMKKIYKYRNNWATDDDVISVSRYENGIPYSWRKYYNPEWSPKGEILYYTRKPVDYYMNTNRILSYPISYVSANAFQTGEIVDLKFGGEIVATGEAEYANATHLWIKSVSGNTIANSSIVVNILGESSYANATANAVSTVHESIPLEEEVFWSPYYYFEYELEKNETKKHINLVNSDLSPLIIQDFTNKLRE